MTTFATNPFDERIQAIVYELCISFRYHKAHLTRRLILDCSTDSDLEENMVEWLRVSCFACPAYCSGPVVLKPLLP